MRSPLQRTHWSGFAPLAAGFLKSAPLLLGFFNMLFKTFGFDFGAALVFGTTSAFPLQQLLEMLWAGKMAKDSGASPLALG